MCVLQFSADAPPARSVVLEWTLDSPLVFASVRSGLASSGCAGNVP